jgi:SEC-C motif
MWDNLLQRLGRSALKGTLSGANPFREPNPVLEMAKEPRFIRRQLSKSILESIEKFPAEGFVRLLSSYASYYPEKRYLFLQLIPPDDQATYLGDYRTVRKHMLEVACGVLRNKNPDLKEIIAIGIDAPKRSNGFNSEDILLLDCRVWTDEQRQYYAEANEEFRFLELPTKEIQWATAMEFPDALAPKVNLELRPFDHCPCNSGRSFSECCGRWMN